MRSAYISQLVLEAWACKPCLACRQREFKLMKPGALLVNVARAAVVDKQVGLTHLDLLCTAGSANLVHTAESAEPLECRLQCIWC